MTNESQLVVYIVDDDRSVRLSLEMLLCSANMEVMAYESAKDFLESEIKKENVCLVTDIKMKGMSGLDLQEELNNRGISLPIIFLTAFDSDNERKQAQSKGAKGFFRKPVDDSALIDAIKWAVGKI